MNRIMLSYTGANFPLSLAPRSAMAIASAARPHLICERTRACSRASFNAPSVISRHNNQLYEYSRFHDVSVGTRVAAMRYHYDTL